MKDFSLKSEKPIELQESNILEFSELKDEIQELTNKVLSDYNLLKQFTEDVSHELQTPLAIMQAKIENLLNDTGLKQEPFNNLVSLQKDIQRLAQLNKKLVLLTKIDNRQYLNFRKLDFVELVLENINNFKEITSSEIFFNNKNKLQLIADPQLIQVLFSNLLSNAIKYCPPGGEIKVSIEERTLEVVNSGDTALSHSEKLFTRFYKGKGEKSGTGLGLAIVNKICNLYNYGLQYEFEDHRHTFRVFFKDAEVQNS